MKVMTFNIQHCFDYRKKKINVDLFAKKILEYDADFCGLNEVRGRGLLFGYTDQIKKLSAVTKTYGYFAEAIKVKGLAPYGNAILCKKILRLAEIIRIPDPEIKDENVNYETRCMIKALVEENGRKALFIVTHMGLAVSERKNAVKMICEIADNTDLPIVLMGDFNACPDEEVLKPLFERFSDALEGEDAKTFPSYNPEKRIDYILYRGVECKDTKVINEVVSDHLPIITEVIL